MALCGRRHFTEDEMQAIIFSLAVSLGYDPQHAAELLDEAMSTYETLSRDLKRRKANRASYESGGAQRSRWRAAGRRLASLAVRRQRFLFSKSFELFRIFLRISLVREIKQEENFPIQYHERVLQVRYLKHLVHIGLASNSQLLALALGCFFYQYSPRVIKRLYDQLSESAYEAWGLSNLLEAIESGYRETSAKESANKQKFTAALRQGKSSVQREIRERFRHFTDPLLEPMDILKPAKIMVSLEQHESVAHRRLAELIEHHQPTLLTTPVNDELIKSILASALNHIILEERLLEEQVFAGIERRERQLLFAGYQQSKYENRRILELLFRDSITAQASVFADEWYEVVPNSDDEKEIINLLNSLSPWGIICEGKWENHSPEGSFSSEPLVNPRDEAEADMDHVLIHASCFRNFVQSHGVYSTKRKTFQIPEPRMRLPQFDPANEKALRTKATVKRGD